MAINGVSTDCHMSLTFHHFLLSLYTRDVSARRLALDSLETWAQKVSCTVSTDVVDSSEEMSLNHQKFSSTDHLPVLLMLSLQCPFTDVRERIAEILTYLQKYTQVPVSSIKGPSSFIPVKEVVLPSTDNLETQMLFIDAFLQNNRLDHITQIVGYHPQYLDPFLRTQHFILKGDGPLPFDYRHYIAIMAAARHNCTYLINLQKQEFIIQGGNKTWLEGLKHVPKKLQDLNEINKILAHRPWLISKSHIEKLTKGKENWSLSEVVHAIVLLAHFHSLSSFVFGSGINPEVDHEGHTFQPQFHQSANGIFESDNCEGSIGSTDENSVEELMQKMKFILEQRSEEPTHEEKVKLFQKVESQSVELATGFQQLSPPKSDISRFNDDPDFTYQDFARRGEPSEIPTFRIQDYSWDDHGYSLVNRLYNDVGNLLDEKFKMAANLTYYTMGRKNNVDTTMFRRAIWNYIHCVYGIRHDDYDYREVNDLLERNLKTYIKTICCFPDQTTKKNYDSVMRAFRHSEKVHVNLMMFEARMQAELLYALRAIMQYMT